MMNERARVNVEAKRILVGCSANATQLPIDPQKKLSDQAGSAIFAHERQCGRCDTTEAYARWAPGFNVAAARSIQDQIDEKRRGQET